MRVAYDPAARRERYLRTRQLKGRRAGSEDDTSGGQRGARPNQAPRPRNPAAARQAEIHRQRQILEARLDRLKEVLRQKVEVAKRRSGADTPTTPTKTTSSKGGGSNDTASKTEKLSATEKAEKAKKAREDYKKDHPSQPSLDELRSQIRQIRKDIQDAIDDARRKHAGSVGASNSTTANTGRR